MDSTHASTTLHQPAVTGSPLLRMALKLDAIVTGANGAAYLAAAGPLGDLFDLPVGALRATGAFLLLFAAAVWLLATRPAPAPAAVLAVVVANAVWAVDSGLLAALDWGTPSTVGTIWIVLQALVVGGFAALQLVALRRSR